MAGPEAGHREDEHLRQRPADTRAGGSRCRPRTLRVSGTGLSREPDRPRIGACPGSAEEPGRQRPHDGGYGGKTSGSSPRRPKVEGFGAPGAPKPLSKAAGRRPSSVKGHGYRGRAFKGRLRPVRFKGL